MSSLLGEPTTSLARTSAALAPAPRRSEGLPFVAGSLARVGVRGDCQRVRAPSTTCPQDESTQRRNHRGVWCPNTKGGERAWGPYGYSGEMVAWAEAEVPRRARTPAARTTPSGRPRTPGTTPERPLAPDVGGPGRAPGDHPLRDDPHSGADLGPDRLRQGWPEAITE